MAKEGYIDLNDAKKLYELQNDYLTTPVMLIGTVNIAADAENKYRNYFDEIIKKYSIDTTNLQGIMPDGKIRYFTEEVKRKYRPKFQWPLKHKDYGDDSLK